ncbi:hypothetical protein ACOSP7_026279 [Xanthoceras sorbifolium]
MNGLFVFATSSCIFFALLLGLFLPFVFFFRVMLLTSSMAASISASLSCLVGFSFVGKIG